jgi:PAS domain S-box-containing protein
MDSAIVVVDRTGRIVHWNEEAEEYFGYANAEAVGQRVDLIVPEDQRDRHWEGFDRVMAGGERHLEGAAINLPVRHRNGDVLAFPARFNHLFDPHGHAVGAVAVFGARHGDEQPWTPIAR